MFKISVCQRQFPRVPNSVLFSGNTDSSLNWFLFDYSLQHHQPFVYIYIHSLLQCHLEENVAHQLWRDLQPNKYIFNEPPSLLSWHKLHFCSAHHTAGSQELSSKPLYDFHCSFFSCFSSYPPLSYGPALVYVASRSRLQPYWEAVHWEWIVGFEFLLWFKAGQSTAEQHNAAYYPPWAWSAAAARVIANTTGASASSKSKLSVVLRRHYVFRERERTSMLIYQKWLQHSMCVVCFEDRSYHPHLTK